MVCDSLTVAHLIWAIWANSHVPRSKWAQVGEPTCIVVWSASFQHRNRFPVPFSLLFMYALLIKSILNSVCLLNKSDVFLHNKSKMIYISSSVDNLHALFVVCLCVWVRVVHGVQKDNGVICRIRSSRDWPTQWHIRPPSRHFCSEIMRVLPVY